MNAHLGKPLIFGAAYEVPALTWKFQSSTAPSEVIAMYQWLWIEYPYPERAFGAWVTSQETVICSEPSLQMTVPARTVQPRGWYKGWQTALPWLKPKFDQVEFRIVWERNCEQTLMLSRKILSKFRDHDAVLKRSCGAPEQIEFIRKKE